MQLAKITRLQRFRITATQNGKLDFLSRPRATIV
jgi:hypothetical protein